MVTLAALYTGQSLINCVLQCQHIWSVKHVVKKNDIYVLGHYVAAREVEKMRFSIFEKLPTTTTITRRCTVLCEIFHTEQNPECVTCNIDY